MKRCYLAGPMRGYPQFNFPAFFAAAASLRERGYEVWSPAENDVHEDGFDPAKDQAQPMRHYMKRDLPAVLDADFVAVLPGWERSRGAMCEVAVARACDIPVLDAATLEPVPAQTDVNKSGSFVAPAEACHSEFTEQDPSTTKGALTMAVRCKFVVQSVTRRKNWDKSKPDLYDVKLTPVTSGSAENAAFYAATPGGSIDFSTINEAAASALPLGGEVYVDFTRVEQPEQAAA